jgi:hypothetical protein
VGRGYVTWRMLVPDRRVVELAVFLGLAVFLLLVHPTPFRLNLHLGPALRSAPAQPSSTGEAEGTPGTRAPATSGSELMSTLTAPTPIAPARSAERPPAAPAPQPTAAAAKTAVPRPLQPPPLSGPTAQPVAQPPAVVEPSPVVDEKTAGHSQGCVQASTSANGKACAPPGQQQKKKGPPGKP